MKLSNLKTEFIYKNYKILILLILIIFLIASFYRSQNLTRGIYSLEKKDVKFSKDQEKDPYFDIRVLKIIAEKDEKEGRDLFSYFTPPIQNTMAPPPPPVVNEPKNEIRNEIQTAAVAQEPTIMSQIKIFGILSKNGKELYAFLSDGKEVYVVKKNDIFANQFRVTHIDEDKIEFSTLNNNFKKTLFLSGG